MTLEEQTFDLIRPPEWKGGVIFASPHSGRHYPAWFLAESRLDPLLLRSSEDAFMDRLIASAPDHGAALLTARVPRCVIDLNRGPEEIDPLVVSCAPPVALSPRIMAGLGVIPRVVSGGRAIYRGKLPRAQAEARLRDWWHPWHQTLAGLIEDTRTRFGEAVLIDCHSMPHEAIDLQPRPGCDKPQIVLGDRFGAAASRDIVDRIATAFEAAGLRVSRNMPFAGAYITQAYGRPSRRVHAVQIEIDRRLYMDETRIEPHSGFSSFRQLITGVLAEITGTATGSCDGETPTLAAE